MGLVVPVSAAVIDSTTAPEPPAVQGATTANASFFVHGAPQPLLLMALGALVVLIPVTRRALRSTEPVASPVERAPQN